MIGEDSSGVDYSPLDVTKLVKGQILTLDELERHTGVLRSYPKWRLKLLRVQQEIARERAKRGLGLLTLRILPDQTLKVLDDAEAAQYNARSGKAGIRRFVRAVGRNIAVDTTQLTVDEARSHDRELRKQAMILGALRSTVHRPLPQAPPERVTPRMICGDLPIGALDNAQPDHAPAATA